MSYKRNRYTEWDEKGIRKGDEKDEEEKNKATIFRFFSRR